MNTFLIVLALLGSMMFGVLVAVLIDTFYVKRWHEAMQDERALLEEELHKLTEESTNQDTQAFGQKIRAYQRELEEEQKEVSRLDDLRIELETRLETAVAEVEALKSDLDNIDADLDGLRDEKIELARQLTVAQIEMKHMAEDLEQEQQKSAKLDEFEAENQRLTTTLELVERERNEREEKIKDLLNQLAETDKLRANLQDAEARLKTTSAKINNMETALDRANAQIKHTGKSQLQIIKGIGPATDRKLKAAGIVTVADLSRQTPERIREILNLKPTSRMKPEAWIEEAHQLAPTFAEELS